MRDKRQELGGGADAGLTVLCQLLMAVRCHFPPLSASSAPRSPGSTRPLVQAHLGALIILFHPPPPAACPPPRRPAAVSRRRTV
ncbi:hypothetical protein C8F04DRAFT_1274581 [Mycena alexandri]|uniref:Uncharacterized protein n=1 Tax=Mycena alexandri TaxID=1745969 RepID=A0AAD6S4L9_9AGAR|nr:hypothetical protein C8F04DRAFT_1274581 [Mycena alexandri]